MAVRVYITRLSAVVGFVILVRLVLVWTIALFAHISPADVVSGHDGAEYLAMARAFSTGEPSSIPAEVRRHDVGFALLLSLLLRFMPDWVAALVLSSLALGASVILLSEMCRRHLGCSSNEALRVAFAWGVAYPASVYFGVFALSEPLFVSFILVATFALLERRWLISALACAAAFAVRSTGIFLVFACLAGIWNGNDDRRERMRLCLSFLFVAGGLILVFLAWNTSILGLIPSQHHQPQFGLPFASFRELAQRGVGREIYIALCVAFFIFALFKLVREWRASVNPFVVVAVVFCGTFLAFHLILESLVYYGKRIYTAEYLDRYLVALWPFAAVSVRRWWRWPIIIGALLISLVLSLYWGVHYFEDVRRHGAPLLEHLREAAVKSDSLSLRLNE